VFNGNASQLEKPAADSEQQTASAATTTRQSPQPLIAQKQTRAEITGVYKVAGTNPDGSRYKGMVSLEEVDGLYNFTWWIGRDVFKGKGELAGRMLVVHWNDLHPVVYAFAEGGVLDGEWADGSATDRLTPFATATNGEPAEGSYRIKGRNADGGSYSGNMNLSRDGDEYRLEWKIGSSAYEGRGRFRNGIMIVDWGGVTPLVYALKEDGSLSGLWDGGLASETATPR
jgi:hypothetical protein